MTTFTEFIKLQAPSIVTFFLSFQAIKFTNTLADSTVNPALGLLPGLDQDKAVLKFRNKAYFKYGQLLVGFVNFFIALLFAFALVKFASKVLKVEVIKK